jgi:hypothetical protein
MAGKQDPVVDALRPAVLGSFLACGVLFVDPACVLGCDLVWVLDGEQTHLAVAGSRCHSDATVWRLLGKRKQWCDLLWVLGGDLA